MASAACSAKSCGPALVRSVALAARLALEWPEPEPEPEPGPKLELEPARELESVTEPEHAEMRLTQAALPRRLGRDHQSRAQEHRPAR